MAAPESAAWEAENAADDYMEALDDDLSLRADVSDDQQLALRAAPVGELTVLEDAIDPHNPLLKRFQQTLAEHLSKYHERLLADLIHAHETLKHAHQQRQAVSEEVQQVVAQLDVFKKKLLKRSTELSALTAMREEGEAALVAAKAEAVQAAATWQVEVARHAAASESLSSAEARLKMIQLRSAALEADVAAELREADKQEADVAAIELEKSTQDRLLLHLEGDVKVLESKLAQYGAQHVAQKQETLAARDILSDAATEMEAIQFEKKQLLHQWRSSLATVSHRDRALQALDSDIAKSKEQLLQLESEYHGYLREIRSEQEKNERLTSILNKNETEVLMLTKLFKKNQLRRVKLLEQMSALHQSLDLVLHDLAKAKLESQAVDNAVALAQKKGDHVVNSMQSIEEEIKENLQLQQTLELSSQNRERSASKLADSIDEKEMEVAQLENELARQRLDSLSTRAHNQQLQERLKRLVGVLDRQQEQIGKYEVEIRRRHQHIDKRSSELSFLNKKYDLLVCGHAEDNMGPLERTIYNVSNEIAQQTREVLELQHYWLRGQTELVDIQKEMDALLATIGELRARHTILQHKNLRLQQHIASEDSETKEIDMRVRSLRNSMTKLNLLIAKNRHKNIVLTQDNIDLQREFLNHLKDAEMESVKLDRRIDEVLSEKRERLSEVMNAERAIALWERKIQIANETQAALDPDCIAAETKMMKQEIHRMKLRLNEQQRYQISLAREVERTVTKVAILSYQKESSQKTAAQAEKHLQHKVDGSNKQMKLLRRAITSFTKVSAELQECKEQVAHELLSLSAACDQAHRERSHLKNQLEQHASAKLLQVDELMRYQKASRKFTTLLAHEKADNGDAVDTGTLTVALEKAGKAAERELARQQEREQKINQVLSALTASMQQPQLDDGSVQPSPSLATLLSSLVSNQTLPTLPD